MSRKIVMSIGLLISIIFLVTGCNSNPSQVDAKELFTKHIAKFADIESYKAVMTVSQEYAGFDKVESEIVVYENVKENAFYYIASMEGENAIEIYQLDDTFTIRFNIMGFVHTETFTGEEFEQTGSEVYLMESFQDLSAFSNFKISETRQHYVITADSLIDNLIVNELFPSDNGVVIESGEITVYVSKKTEFVERMTLETVMIVNGERLASSSEVTITDINKTNDIKSLIYN